MSVTLSVPVRAPATVGLKATYTEQLALAANVVPQPSSSSKEVAFVPLSVIEVSVTTVDPEFVRVTIWRSLVLPIAVLGNASDVALKLSVEAALAPVPDSATVCAVLDAESVNEIVAASAPTDFGVKVMV